MFPLLPQVLPLVSWLVIDPPIPELVVDKSEVLLPAEETFPDPEVPDAPDELDVDEPELAEKHPPPTAPYL